MIEVTLDNEQLRLCHVPCMFIVQVSNKYVVYSRMLDERG
ncbi:MAG: hypothetical protein ACI90V_013186, partial [Bacillariaceae sp.]